jgi:hypothetical protein
MICSEFVCKNNRSKEYEARKHIYVCIFFSPDVKNAKNDTRTHLEQLHNYCSVLDSVNKAVFSDLTARVDEVVNSVVPSVRARKTRVSNNEKTAPEVSAINNELRSAQVTF